MNTKTSTKIPVIVIFAPTASGKTALTRELFSLCGSHFLFKAEIISADSQAVYKGMDIGTAKPEPELCKEIPHHLINLITPDKQFNVSDFVDNADKCCEEIYERGNIPVVCGGTGFYIRNFLYGVAKTPESDEKIRKELQERIKSEGSQKLYEELKIIDSESAKKIHPNDEYRICRALEIYKISGKTRTDYKIEPKLREKYDFTFIILEPPREVLYERINQRVDQMFNAGLAKEISNLKEQGYTKNSPGLKAIGYSEWFEYDDEEIVREEIKHHSRKYAKKQYTYIRDIKNAKIIEYNGTSEDIENIRKIINKKN